MKRFPRSIVIIIFLLFLVSAYTAAQTATIDLTSEKQYIRGFGGANIPGWIDDLTPDQVDKAFGNDPGQIGFSILRVRIPFDALNFDQEVPAAVRAKSHGAIVIASPWTPPPEMKTNNNIIGGRLEVSSYGDYADHLNSFADYVSSNGASLYAISLQNEPDVQVTYESCDWTPEEMINFLINHGPEFGSVKLIVAESYNFDKSMTDPILNNAEAESQVDIIGGHIYGGGLSDYLLARSKGKEVWMTEHGENTTTWSAALETGKEIHDCMVANFNAYIWWYIRRSYGPIIESGNISKRGYVMSHYAKFVRPGFTRVDATTSPAANIHVTAFKNGTDAVIVVINRNSSSGNLEFILQNGTVTSFTKYTTSGSKSMNNDGTISVSGGTFSTTLDAQSITTFTTFTGNAGDASNSPPVANTGPDLEVTDSDNNGSEPITLDGSASSDSDGVITNYTWAESGYQMNTGETPLVNMSIGKHTIILTVTDDDGATDMDTVIITVNLPGGVEDPDVWLEAECGTVGSNWNIRSDANASNGEYVMIKSGNNSINSPSGSSDDHIIYTFNISETGSYILWGRTYVPNADDDSFWVLMDSGNWIKWNSIRGGPSWQWDEVHDSDNGGQVVNYNLEAGDHTLTIAYREDGAGLDKLYLTYKGITPASEGFAASNCNGGQNGDISIPDKFFVTALSGNYPNPVINHTTIEFTLEKDEYVNLVVMDITGRTILTLVNGMKQAGKHEAVLDGVKLENGVYFYRLSAGEYSKTMQMIICR
jgi:O-glycosyl hydrolase